MRLFIGSFLKVLLSAVGTDFPDNHDTDRFGPENQGVHRRNRFACRRPRPSWLNAAVEAGQTVKLGLELIKSHLLSLEWVHGKLADDESKKWLVKLVAYRALGHRKIKLPTNSPEFLKAKEMARQIPHGEEEIDPEFLGWKLHQRSLQSFGYPIRMFTNAGACVTTFVHQQYRCETAEGPIECAPGDMVVDAGGCYGDTALYFAHQAGPGGRVASFEFLPVNVSVFGRNMELNPELAARIRLYENPVYSTSGQELFVVGNGPGTRVLPTSSDPKASKVRTLKIDDLVASGDFPRIDFIKMDIEGAELEALKGSESVLRQFKPKLAITVYHHFKDFWTIPQYLDSLGLGYRFYLRHFTIHAEETVLFAKA